jgi:enoyl-CoA hydratase
MGTALVKREEDRGLVTITFDAPPLNTFDEPMIAAVGGAFDRLLDEAPRAVLIRAEGRVVSAGVDINLFDGLGAAGARKILRAFLTITHTLEALPCPVIFAAHATTLTAAFEIALASDLVVASRSARFGLVEAVVGVSPGMGGTQRLAAIAGPMRAKELVMTAELYPAATLAEWGVVNRVYDDDALPAESVALARRIADGPTAAHAVTKRIARAWNDGGVPLADSITTGAVAGLFDTDDVRTAVSRFVDKSEGPTRFRGR